MRNLEEFVIRHQPEGGPSYTAVKAAENLAIWPPRIKSSDHDGSRILEVNRDSAESKVQVRAGNRSDICPDTRSDVVLGNVTYSLLEVL